MKVRLEAHRPQVDSGTVDSVRLSPDLERVAFARTGLVEGIYVGDLRAGDDGPFRKLEHFAASDLAWSTDGARIAYRTGSAKPGFGEQIGWLDSAAGGSSDRVAGMAFAWGIEPHVLYVADADAGQIARIDTAAGTTASTTTNANASLESLSTFELHRDPLLWPQLAPSPDGGRLAFTSRDDFKDASWIHCIERKSGELRTKPITAIPGAQAHVFPFWSPQGGSLGMHIVHRTQQRTGTVVLRHMQGEGEIVYRHDAIDEPRAPAWSPDSRYLALYRAVPTTPDGSDALQQLILLDLTDGSAEPLCEPGAVQGDLRFLADGRLLVDGGTAAYVLVIDHDEERDG